jgi:hypothetical protein
MAMDLSLTDNTTNMLNIGQFEDIHIPSLDDNKYYTPEQSNVDNHYQ